MACPTTSARPARASPPRRATCGSSDDAIADYARTLPAGVAARRRTSRPGSDRRGARRVQTPAQRGQLRLGLVPDAAQAAGLSGFRTVEAGLRARGPWTRGRARRAWTPAAAAAAFGAGPRARADGALRPRAARARRARGRPSTAARSSRSAAPATARPSRSPSGSPPCRPGPTPPPTPARTVPFFKRAQLAAADLHLQGLAPAHDLGRADPVRRQPRPARAADRRRAAFDDALVARIDRGS